jgi:hypothetical protein
MTRPAHWKSSYKVHYYINKYLETCLLFDWVGLKYSDQKSNSQVKAGGSIVADGINYG